MNMETFFKTVLATICIIILLPNCSSNKKDEESKNRSFPTSYIENELNSDSNTENELNTVSDWIDIGKVSTLWWIEKSIEKWSYVETNYSHCWYKMVGGEKIYAAVDRDKTLTKNTYDQIKVGKGQSGDLSEGYNYVDVSGYNYMHQYISNGDKFVIFVSLP